MIQIASLITLLTLTLTTFSITTFTPTSRSEGDNAKVIRIIGGSELPRLDPFLMLDYFSVRLPGGFPDHPHRGFETITYIKSGSIYHEDFKGHKGVIGEGDVQWMTAGKGIVHAEMPASFEEDSVGFQLWLNLKSSEKMKEPHYQEFKSEEFPIVHVNNSNVKVICGKVNEKKGPIEYSTPVSFFDVEIESEGFLEIEVDKEWNSLIYVYDGNLDYFSNSHKKTIKNKTCLILSTSKSEKTIHRFTNEEKQTTRFVFLSGQPLNEPVVSHGPFVLNTHEEMQETFNDFRRAKNGFEGANVWTSKIKNMKNPNFNDL